MTKAEWEEWKDDNRGDISALKNFASDEDIYCLDDVIGSDYVDDFVRERLDNGGWQGVACCISDIINCMNDDWYEIDGYGNLTPCSDWDTLAGYVEDELEFDSPTCDNCGEEYEEEELKSLDDWIADMKDDFIITDKEIEKLNVYSLGDICVNCFKETLEEVREELESED